MPGCDLFRNYTTSCMSILIWQDRNAQVTPCVYKAEIIEEAHGDISESVQQKLDQLKDTMKATGVARRP